MDLSRAGGVTLPFIVSKIGEASLACLDQLTGHYP